MLNPSLWVMWTNHSAAQLGAFQEVQLKYMKILNILTTQLVITTDLKTCFTSMPTLAIPQEVTAPKLPGPPALQRAISAKTPGGGAPPQLMRAVSGGNAGRPRQVMGYTPTLMMGIADPRWGAEKKLCLVEVWEKTWQLDEVDILFLKVIVNEDCIIL